MSTTPPPSGTTPPYRKSTPPSNREVTISATNIQPPSPLYVQAEDYMLYNFFYPTFVPGGNFVIQWRFLRPDGEIVTSRGVIVPTGTSIFGSIYLGEGYLLSVLITSLAVVPNDPGGVFCTLSIVRQPASSTIELWQLIADYITQIHRPSWPYGVPRWAQDGPGRIRSITGTTPAAGAEISETAPTNTRWLLLGIRYSLVTSAVAGNRSSILTFDDGANTFGGSAPGSVQAASNTLKYYWSPTGATSGALGNTTFGPLPTACLLNAAFRFRTATSNIDVGDQYTAPQYLVQEWVNT